MAKASVATLLVWPAIHSHTGTFELNLQDQIPPKCALNVGSLFAGNMFNVQNPSGKYGASLMIFAFNVT